MKALVLDTSVAIAWCFEDESTPASSALLESLPSRAAIVPALWRWETANALLVAERRRRIDAASAERFLRLLDRLPIRVDEEAAGHAIGETRRLASGLGLSVYDASYLELARRVGIPLATRDAELMAAARSVGVALLPA